MRVALLAALLSLPVRPALAVILFTADTDSSGGVNAIGVPADSNLGHLPSIGAGVTLTPPTAALDGVTTGPVGGTSYSGTTNGIQKGGTTHFVHVSYTLPTSGFATLTWEASDVIDTGFDSGLAIDNVKLNGALLFGFESGIPAGFTQLGFTGASPAVTNLSPTQGTSFAYLDSRGSIAATYDTVDGTQGSRLISSQFAVVPGDVLELDMAFLTGDYDPFHDYAVAELLLTQTCGDGTVNGVGEVCDEGPANGTAGSCCTSSCTYRAAGQVCRTAAGGCDLAETCSGASGACPIDQVKSAATLCRGAVGPCDVAENCDGVSVNCPADAKSTAECRAAQGVCDVAESCDGSSDTCPPDAKASAGTACSGDTYGGFGGNGTGWTLNHALGDDPVVVAGDVLTITNNGFDDHNSAFLNTPKSIATFTAEFTYQASGARVADGAAFVLHNDPAGPAAVGSSGGGGALGYSFIAPSAAVEFNIWAGQGMGTGYYTGGQTAQTGGPTYISTLPVDLASGHPIRVTLTYDGTTLTETLLDLSTSGTFTQNFTVDIPAAAGGSTAYIGFTGGTGGGNSIQTISDFSYSSTGDDGNPCTANQCDGVSNACQSLPGNAGATCRASLGVCDPAEVCDGANSNCPADVLSTGSCRAAVDACDAEEFCDGMSPGCPADAKSPIGSPCGDPSDTQCTHPDTCDGAGVCLNHDEPSGTACGSSSTSDCDAADACDNAGTCQPNHVAAGTPCTSDGELCTVDECDGLGFCAHPAGNVGTPCRAAAGECDVAEVCDGSTPACPPNAFVPSGTACGDPADTPCGNPDSCDGAGSCAANNEPAGTSCSDGNACTSGDQCDGNDACIPGAPIVCPACELCDTVGGCTPVIEMACESGVPGKSTLVISNNGDDSKDRLTFRWKGANVIQKTDFGTPTTDTDYQLCVYDDKASPGLPHTLVYSIQAPAAGTCDGIDCWRDLSKGYLYKDNLLTPDGAQKVLLRAGDAGKSRVLFKARGSALGLVPHNDGVFFSQSNDVTVVLAAEHAPKCFKAVFPRPWLKNLPSGYRDKN